MRALLLVMTSLLAAGCCHRPEARPEPTTPGVTDAPAPAPPPPPGAADEVVTVVQRFVLAADGGDFEAAFGLLSGGLRARYSPERLASDHAAAGSAAANALARVRAALDGGVEPVVESERAWIPLGGGLAVRLVPEAGTWRIAALE